MKLAATFVAGASAAQFTAKPLKKIVIHLEDMAAANLKEQRSVNELCEKQDCWYKNKQNDLKDTISNLETSINDQMSKMEKNAALFGDAGAKFDNAITDRNDAKDSLLDSLCQEGVSEVVSWKPIGQAPGAVEPGFNQNTPEECIEKGRRKVYQDNSRDKSQAIKALQDAIRMLEKHHNTPSTQGFVQARATLKQLNAQFPLVALSQGNRDALTTLLQQSPDGRNDAADGTASFSSYTSQSGAIFGVLGQMLKEFQADLKQMNEEDAAATKAFIELSNSLKDQIKSLSNTISTLSGVLGMSSSDRAAAKQALADNRKALAQANTDLNDTGLERQTSNQECNKRKALMSEEAEALSMTIKILDSEKAFKHFSAALTQTGTSLLQVTPASKTLRLIQSLQRSGAPASLLSVAAGLKQKGVSDFFTTLIESIDKMVADLKQQRQDDNNKKDSCNENTQASTMKLDELGNSIEKLDAEAARIEGELKKTDQNIEKTETTLKKLAAAQKSLSELRTKNNAAFVENSANNAECIKILDAAAKVLQKFYSKHQALAQITQKPELHSAKLGAGRGPQQLIASLKNEMVEEQALAVQTEKDETATFIQQSKDNQASTEDNQKILGDLNGKKADLLSDQDANENELAMTQTENSNAETARAALDQQCVQFLKVFAETMKTRNEEQLALETAKNFLKGTAKQGPKALAADATMPR